MGDVEYIELMIETDGWTYHEYRTTCNSVNRLRSTLDGLEKKRV